MLGIMKYLWIGIDENLPDYDTPVLVKTRYGTIFVAELCDSEESHVWGYSDHWEEVINRIDYKLEEITHWIEFQTPKGDLSNKLYAIRRWVRHTAIAFYEEIQIQKSKLYHHCPICRKRMEKGYIEIDGFYETVWTCGCEPPYRLLSSSLDITENSLPQGERLSKAEAEALMEKLKMSEHSANRKVIIFVLLVLIASFLFRHFLL